ncbi:MAG: OsmC family protein [Gammaproteobacteria bacterium]|nr:OsmC family protein [Gammaproteobacteria bacterium]
MKARVTWAGDLTFIGESNSGHAIAMSAGAANGGRDTCIRPMEMVLLGMGGCTSIDVVSILKKSRQDVADCEVLLEAERATTTPAVFTKINVHFIVTGRGLTDEQVKRAVDLSADKYCSVSIMLGKAVEITHSYEVRNAE